MIKVEHTKTHVISPYYSKDGTEGQSSKEILVAPAKLVLVEYNYGSTPNKKGEICKFPYGLNIAGQDDIGYPVVKSIFISETEKIEDGDWYLDKYNEIHLFQSSLPKYHYINAKKILALPEHFSPQQLQMIVDGKLKDGDKVLIECETRVLRPELGPIFQGVSGLEYLNDIIIKLNPHITIYPVEEKMVPLSKIKEIAWMAWHKCMTIPLQEDSDRAVFEKWFEQNVK